uniref:PAS domain-containing protein n=1 Tax=Noctiluca scintillans TaxID=2966 RepID=A0A7S1AC99_NOCSC|mmetsp:Transcript_40440/g.107216  ORF Transcript_40440/g.107216 Transcript_40440/m.107216 type:complete len:255 (+) Transcript_40440:121-885(+)
MGVSLSASSEGASACECFSYKKNGKAIASDTHDGVVAPERPFLTTDTEWATNNSIALQGFVDSVCTSSMNGIKFSVTVASPLLEDCPLVQCSIGFSELTGYRVEEIVGRNCRFLLDGVPEHLIRQDTRIMCRSFCANAREGSGHAELAEKIPEALRDKTALSMPDGELICVQANARKDGELFSNMFYMREVELDDDTFILGLQCEMPDDSGHALDDVNGCFADYFFKLNANMDALEQVLSNQFWYSGPMRRQFS